MRSRSSALALSALWLLIAPGTIAGLLPWAISGWRLEGDFGGSAAIQFAGILLIGAGLAGIIESFVRFVWEGRGTPAPVAPTERLIFSGLYRHVRNPMYLSVMALLVGQALLFGQWELVVYAALLWVGFHLFVIAYEEPALHRQFPDEYSAYRAEVHRWLPRLGPWRQRGS